MRNIFKEKLLSEISQRPGQCCRSAVPESPKKSVALEGPRHRDAARPLVRGRQHPNRATLPGEDTWRRYTHFTRSGDHFLLADQPSEW